MNKRIRKKRRKQAIATINKIVAILDTTSIPISEMSLEIRLAINRYRNALTCLLNNDVWGYIEAVGIVSPREQAEFIEKMAELI